jgi:hypothetical protein
MHRGHGLANEGGQQHADSTGLCFSDRWNGEHVGYDVIKEPECSEYHESFRNLGVWQWKSEASDV